MREEPIDDLDRLLRVVDGDVHVHPEDELAASDVLQLVDQGAVPVLRGDPLPLEEAEGMRAGRSHAQALVPSDAGDVARKVVSALIHITRCPAHRGRDLEDRLHELRVYLRLELVPADRGHDRVDVLHEIERGRVEELVLLLDAERVRVTAAGVIDHALRRRSLEPRDRGRDRLLRRHGRTASASISTFHAGSSRAVTTIVLAGRISAKTSPWARPTASKCAGSVTWMRVDDLLETHSALSRARPMICRQERACS